MTLWDRLLDYSWLLLIVWLPCWVRWYWRQWVAGWFFEVEMALMFSINGNRFLERGWKVRRV